ncbi:transcriptional regulator [Opitutaceae bacterium TAV1]|nr:transcriptional regulator [Opitutaceae bacterium TAV1]
MKPSRITVAEPTAQPAARRADAAGAGASGAVAGTSALPPFVVDRESAQPLHRQIEQWLRTRIENGDLTPGAMLPARKELCELFGGINHLTIRKAVAALQGEGLLFSVQGSGTYVTDKTTKPLRIAIVLPNLDDELTREIVDGVHETFDAHKTRARAQVDSSANAATTLRAAAIHAPQPDVNVVIFDSRRDVEKEIQNIAQLEDLPLDGAIILPVSFGDILDKLARLKADRFPTVILARIQGMKFNTVSSDDYDGGYAATKYILEKTGRRRLAWIGNRKGHFSDVQRYDGYRDALNDHGIACDRKLVRDLKVESPVAPFEPALREALDSLLGVTPEKRPDAILCANDLVALACIEELSTRNIHVPRDIAVVGFDDIAAAARARPALTTVHNPMRELGCEAACLMLAAIQEPDAPPRNIIVPISLVVRESA